MNFPENLLYTKDHEWAQEAGDGVVTIGITDHAQDSLGEVVFVDLPKVGKKLAEHETFGVVESIKAVSDLYAPVAGEVIAVNEALSSEPGAVNQSPYEAGWLIKVRVADKSSLSSLLNAAKYRAHVESLKS